MSGNLTNVHSGTVMIRVLDEVQDGSLHRFQFAVLFYYRCQMEEENALQEGM